MVFDNKILENEVDRLPLTLTVTELAGILRISKKNTYELVHSDSFPSITVGRRILIPKPAFKKWLENPNHN
jgi:excisionase family DNA binding protein